MVIKGRHVDFNQMNIGRDIDILALFSTYTKNHVGKKLERNDSISCGKGKRKRRYFIGRIDKAWKSKGDRWVGVKEHSSFWTSLSNKIFWILMSNEGLWEKMMIAKYIASKSMEDWIRSPMKYFGGSLVI